MRRFVRMLAVLAFLTGSLAPVLIALTPDAASATACGTAITAGTSCTLTGTLDVTAGTLSQTSPSALGWDETLNGLDQDLVDTSASDEQYTVNDATGSGAGWHVTLSATTFTNGSHTFPNTGTFSVNGSLSSISATSAPSPTCTDSCTTPTNTTTYPVQITTATSSPTASTIYDTSLNTGLGQVVIGGSTATYPIGWWLVAPASAYSGSYTSTVTVELISGP
jgi:hypothetical protein